MSPDPEPKLLFGDMMAMARERWIRAMAQRLSARGFDGYRRSDPLVMRSLRGGEVPLGSLAVTLGLTRQGARKVVSGLVERGYARLTPSPLDSRRRNVALTPSGRDYLHAVIATLRALNDEVVANVDADQLAAAYAVLEFIKDTIAGAPQPEAALTNGEQR
jgi:MarR family transcriptional regulator, lower aerobic nicotinate degradation pathway regulator